MQAALVLLLALALGSLYFGRRLLQGTDPAGQLLVDPRLAYVGPFQNIHADVKYVGAAVCRECHADIAREYSRHPMARTLRPVNELPALMFYDGEHNNPFQRAGFLFTVRPDPGGIQQERAKLDDKNQALFRSVDTIAYALGSGNHGYSFITNRGGYLFQTPVSWFSQKGIWDLSPGSFEKYLSGRPLVPACLFCHSNRCLPWEDTRNRYHEPIFEGHGIGCERCHGPGEKHVSKPGLQTVGAGTVPLEALGGDVKQADFGIVNPAKLPWQLREAVCQQCHLEGEVRVLPRGRTLFDFRPGLPLESCWSVFVRHSSAGADRKAVNHVEQMYQSRCFLRSGDTNKLGCISCHDPHRQAPAESRAAHYRRRCLQCHDDGVAHAGNQPACALPRPQRNLKMDDCVACHMPRYQSSDIAHAASTDHRIPRVAGPGAGGKTPQPQEKLELVHFTHGPVGPQDAELRRDLGIALAELVVKGKGGLPVVEKAWQLLKGVDGRDREACRHKANVLYRQGRLSAALAAAEAVLKHAPDDEMSLVLAGYVARELGKVEASLSVWRRAVAVNPWMPDYHANIAALLAKKEAWEEVLAACAEWLKLDPASVAAQQLRVQAFLEQGKHAEARTEFARIEALAPPNLHELQIRFGSRVAMPK